MKRHIYLILREFPILLLCMTLALAAGCGRLPGAGPQDVEGMGPQEIFELAERDLETARGRNAAHYFAEIERQYPYSDYTRRALVMQAFAYHKNKKYEDARAAAQRFLDFYPNDEEAGYAQYLLALSYYDQIDEIGRDQGATFQALQALRVVIERYPGTEYAEEAEPKFDLAFDHLASKEMEVGRYYLKSQNYPAAINRFRVVVEEFRSTEHAPEALLRLVESYLALGLTDEAESAGAILHASFADTAWAEEAAKKLAGKGLSGQHLGDNWLSAIYRQTIRGEWL